MSSYRIVAKKALVAAVLAALSACTTVGPDYKVPASAVIKRPDAAKPFIGAAEPAFKSDPLPADWWKLYRDPVLDRLIAKAFDANTDLRVAAANLAHANAVLENVEEKKRPEIEVEGELQRGRIAGASLALPEELPDMNIYSGQVKVGYLLDFFGKVKRAVESAEANSEAYQAALDAAHVRVAADTTRAYADACSAGYQLKVAHHSLEVQQKFVDLTAERVTKGRGIALDNSRARAQLEQLRSALPPLQARQRTALYKLAVLIGEVPSRFPQDAAKCDVPPRVLSAVPVGDGAALLKRRPDIRQAERQLHAATAQIGVATAELYPSIQLGASLGSLGMIPGLGDPNTWHFGIGPLISWAPPATSSARAHIAQAEATTQASLARFDGTVLNALRETESALTVYARELDRNAALKASRDQSALAAQQADKLYTFGRADFLAKLDADRVLAGAESAVAASDAQLAADQVDLFLALGGGWEGAHKQAVHEGAH